MQIVRNGQDITDQVLMEFAMGSSSPGERPGTFDSTQSFTVVGSTLGAFPTAVVEFTATMQPGNHVARGQLLVVAQPVVPMLDEKLCDLFEALGATVDSDGNVCIDMSGTDQEVKDRIWNAVDAFRSSVRDCLNGEADSDVLTFEGEKTLLDGTTLPYCIVLGREQVANLEDKDASAGSNNKEQAIVIAAGGDSPGDGTPGGGGSAKGGSGSVAIGVGGSGAGDHKGGDGEARSRDGKAIGIGGTGGENAGQGGTGRTTSSGTATGFAGGGAGGDPVEDSDKGGHGGGVTVRNGEGRAKQSAGADGGGRGQAGDDGPGTHGTGATGKSTPGELPESTPGTSENNG